MLTIISWLILGALAGYIASLVVGTNDRQGIGGDIVVGIVGAVIGGLVARLFGYDVTEGALNLPSVLTAIVGAVILLFVLRGFRSRRI